MTTLTDHQHAIVLVAAKDERGLWRVARGDSGLATCAIELDYRVNTSRQIQNTAAGSVGLTERFADIVVNGPITPALALADGRAACLWLAKLPEDFQAPAEEWPTLPDLLRSMPKDRNRLSYMKAMQILSGATEQGVNAIELDEQVRNALLNNKQPES